MYIYIYIYMYIYIYIYIYHILSMTKTMNNIFSAKIMYNVKNI